MWKLAAARGLDLREIFVDAKDIQSEGLTDAAYKSSTGTTRPGSIGGECCF